MSNEKGPIEKAKDRVKNIARWSPGETGEKAGIDFLNRGGFQKERFDKIEAMDDRSFIDQDSMYQTAVVPWMNIRDNSFLFDKNDAFYDIKLYYDGLCNHINKLKMEKLVELNEKVHPINVERKLKGEDPLPLFTMDYLNNVIVDTELQDLKVKLETLLIWGAKMNMGLSWSDPDDNKSLVLNKQVIVEPNPQTSQIYELIKGIRGPERLSPEKVE